MDKAYIIGKKFGLGKLTEAVKEKKSYNRLYKCTWCYRQVYLREGYVKRPHFSHEKDSNDSENCPYRVHSFSSNKKSTYSINERIVILQKYINRELSYIPNLPRLIFEDSILKDFYIKTLSNEINSMKAISYDDFFNNAINEINIVKSVYTNHLLNEYKYHSDDILDLYWEIYIRFRIIYNIYNKYGIQHFENEYKLLINELLQLIKQEYLNYKFEPSTIYFHEEDRSLKSYYRGKPETIDQLLNNKEYIISQFDSSQNYYISKDHVFSGSRILVFGKRVSLKKVIHKFELFSKSSLSIVTPINKDFSLGVIVYDIIEPLSLNFSKYPPWIVNNYMVLCGGIKDRYSTKQNIYTTPPYIKLNFKLNLSSFELLKDNEKLKVLDYIILENGVLKFIKELKHGNYLIRIKGTPYFEEFQIKNKMVEDLPDNTFNNSKSREWLLIHSRNSNIAKYKINRLIVMEK